MKILTVCIILPIQKLQFVMHFPAHSEAFHYQALNEKQYEPHLTCTYPVENRIHTVELSKNLVTGIQLNKCIICCVYLGGEIGFLLLWTHH